MQVRQPGSVCMAGPCGRQPCGYYAGLLTLSSGLLFGADASKYGASPAKNVPLFAKRRADRRRRFRLGIFPCQLGEDALVGQRAPGQWIARGRDRLAHEAHELGPFVVAEGIHRAKE